MCLCTALGGALDPARLVHVEPPDLRLAREPRHLPLGVARGVADHEPQRLLHRHPPPQRPRELAVADAVHRRPRRVVAGLEQAPHLVHHATGQHAARALREAPR